MRNHPTKPSSRKFQSDKKPRKWNLIMLDLNTDKEKVIRRNLTEDQWDKYCWKLEQSGSQAVTYYGRAVPTHNRYFGGRRK